ncbi:MAG: hypothetical protein HQ501_11925 [Rhodospirillales bacterium]|nr:hypothetical protein [Rhodospirillales bacterium]
MARKPNYKFERIERDRAKAAKKKAQADAKKERSEGVSDSESPTEQIDQGLSEAESSTD